MAIDVMRDFSNFCSDLRMSNEVVTTVRTRYHAITKRINLDYWGLDSDTMHSLYVGSYGRGTAIYTSDIDIVVELPWSIFSKFSDYIGNGQSYLLQDVRRTLQKTYANSNISGDGQVVVIDFSDGIKFEIVPAFKFDDGQYYYPDTNNGGRWKSMNPNLELMSFAVLNVFNNKNLTKLGRMARAWNTNMYVCMSGILIDTLAYNFLCSYEYRDKSELYFDWMSRDFFRYLVDHADESSWRKFGSNDTVTKKYSFKSEAQKAYGLALDAISAYSGEFYYPWHSNWRDIYGSKFPTS
jgi:hypothetical protein